MKYLLILFAAVVSFASAAQAAGETVVYNDGTTVLEGYWSPSQCPSEKPAPTVLVIHQWKGLTVYEKMRADMLAAQCYNAFAVDMYGQGIRPADNDEAAKQATIYKNDSALARRRINAALGYVWTRQDIDPKHIAAMGYCFGGTMALELARSGADIDGVISFHGGLSTPAPAVQPGAIKTSVRVHHGAADPLVPPEEVAAFRAEMDAAGADWSITEYPGAVHAFTQKDAGNDPSTGVAYNEEADHRSWAATLDFLKETFKK